MGLDVDEHSTVSAPAVKIATAWLAALGISNWSDIAAMFAALYTLLLIMEWFWKKFWRPAFERIGWLKPRLRRQSDREESIS